LIKYIKKCVNSLFNQFYQFIFRFLKKLKIFALFELLFFFFHARLFRSYLFYSIAKIFSRSSSRLFLYATSFIFWIIKIVFDAFNISFYLIILVFVKDNPHCSNKPELCLQVSVLRCISFCFNFVSRLFKHISHEFFKRLIANV
jgi:hypothetical protein